jgi:RimJ/RimL family protein N-acetyltransferase
MSPRQDIVHQGASGQDVTTSPPAREPFTLPPAAAQLERVVTLWGGAAVRVRAIRPDDTPRLRAFHAHLSSDTILWRYLHYVPALSVSDADHITHVDYTNRMALLATVCQDDQERIVAVGSYDRIGPDSAEIAFVVADDWQGRGIATTLLARLAAYARAQGFTTLVALTLSTNRRMLHVLRSSGYPSTVRFEDVEDVEVRLDISEPPDAVFAPLTGLMFPHEDDAAHAHG